MVKAKTSKNGSVSELSLGDYIIHQEHGVAKFLGLKTMNIIVINVEYLQLEYSNNEIMYVPVSQNDLILKYEDKEDEKPNLSKLGGQVQPQPKRTKIIKIEKANELSPGDYVIHREHGIAKYLKLETMDINGVKTDYLQLKYADNEGIYIPVDQIKLIRKCEIKKGKILKLSKLGGKLDPKTKKSKLKRKENIRGVLLAISPLVGYTLFGLIPIVMAVIMSFNEVSGYSLVGMKFVGFANYIEVLKDNKFWLSLRNTFIMALSVPINVVLSLIMAYFLSKGLRGAKVFRAVYFLPFVLSVVAVTYMWQWLFNTQYGVINQWFGTSVDWLGTRKNFLISVTIMNIWSGTGFGIVLYSASLTNVNRTLLEQAEIDGANAFQRFFHVTLPAISPTTFYLFTMGLIGALQAFAVTNILGNNGTGPDDAGLTSVFYIYRNIFSYVNQVGIAAAASWLLAILIMIITSLNFLVSKVWVSYDQ